MVANEVKDLAKESAKATEDITVRIKKIQSDSNDAIESIKAIIENIERVNDMVNSISSAVEEQTVTNSEITRNLTEASKGSGVIAESNSNIASSANEYSMLSNQVKDASSELITLTKALEEALQKNFKL